MSDLADFDQLVEHYHQTLIEFAVGNPVPVTALLSPQDDVSLAGGFGGVTRGRSEVTKNIEIAASRFKEGQISFEPMARYAGDDLGYLVEIEVYKAKISGSQDMARSAIRVTSIFRREDGVWRLVHRHGDPIPAVLMVAQIVAESVVSVKGTPLG